jgi:hypothetical protein
MRRRPLFVAEMQHIATCNHCISSLGICQSANSIEEAERLLQSGGLRG